jgi:hypothetical protein
VSEDLHTTIQMSDSDMQMQHDFILFVVYVSFKKPQPKKPENSDSRRSKKY